VQIVSHRTRHRHRARLRRMVIMTMATPVPDLYPAVTLKFSNDLTDLHSPQRS
jgi:hypothetical protein